MAARPVIGITALRTLAVIRLANGFLALFLPKVLVKRTSADAEDTAPYYAFRMFGIRTLLLGADLLLLRGDELTRARTQAVVIHSTDALSAVVGKRRGDLPPQAAQVAIAISSVNAVLAILARCCRVPRSTHG